MRTAAQSLLLIGLLIGHPPRAAARATGIGERGDFWLGLSADVPVTLRFTLMGFSVYDTDQHHSIDFPFLAIAGDLQRPSGPRDSLSLSFALAPLTGLAAMYGVESGSQLGKFAGLAAAWLSGGTWRWTPGGRCNVGDAPKSCSSLSLAVKHDLGIHPFVQPVYLRSTPGAGLAFRRISWAEVIPGGFTCGAGVALSLAAELHGRSSATPAVWFTCFGGAD